MAVKETVRYFRVTPQIVPADQETTVTIQSLDPRNGFQDGKRYRLRYFAVDRSDNLPAPLWREQEVVAAARFDYLYAALLRRTGALRGY